MLALRAGHLYEEITQSFFMVPVLGMALFLTLNLILIGLIIWVLVGLYAAKRWGFYGALTWAAIEFANGIAHNVAPLIPCLSRLNWAGGATGLALLVISPLFALVARSYYAECRRAQTS